MAAVAKANEQFTAAMSEDLNVSEALAAVFDFVGVCDYHGDEDTIGGGGLVMEPKKKKHYEPRRLL